MTKTIIIGQTAKSNKKNPIVFNYLLNEGCDDCLPFEIVESPKYPKEYKFVELICKNYNDYDLMFAYNNPENRGGGILFIGRWNDGIVEN